MKNLLITGSGGFIGSYFIDKYKDNYNIKTFSFLNDNFNKLNLKDMDVVFHLSGLVHKMGGASDKEYERVNVTQTLSLAKKAKEIGVKQFIFMSTVKVYGEETNVAYRENSDCSPQDEYGKSKLKIELKLLKLESDTFKVSIIRTPVVYGYGVKANIKNLVNLVNKVPILPFGDIKNKRSTVYIGNLCHLVDEIAVQEKPGIFLASDDNPFSTTRLIELIANGLNKKVYLVKIPLFESLLKLLKPSFHKRLYESLEVDNNATKKMLSLVNPYSAEDGIKLMLKDYYQ
ncbi:UDP-glucose 4-epimerase (EC 5.1.3.2) [uncultured Gammaproteobacteria bacterium]|nr:UDP-glucose 4-epimerase (EC 5.1.3.2) [uncultured Gammaproteobacteria bacterium]CAC9602868.1 UDP-glucose 4-epimerase (EC 5.1.3.2) [uncultured Gammaproteobacteria bacterium]